MKNLCPLVIILFLVSPCIHHMNYVIYCNGGLSYVGGEYNLPLASLGPLEHHLLVSYG